MWTGPGMLEIEVDAISWGSCRWTTAYLPAKRDEGSCGCLIAAVFRAVSLPASVVHIAGLVVSVVVVMVGEREMTDGGKQRINKEILTNPCSPNATQADTDGYSWVLPIPVSIGTLTCDP